MHSLTPYMPVQTSTPTATAPVRLDLAALTRSAHPRTSVTAITESPLPTCANVALLANKSLSMRFQKTNPNQIIFFAFLSDFRN